MARIRSTEFVEFAKYGKACKHGALVMKGDEVRSYRMLIAKVDRAERVIMFDNTRVSVTTNCHQHAVSYGYSALQSEGWTLVERS